VDDGAFRAQVRAGLAALPASGGWHPDLRAQQILGVERKGIRRSIWPARSSGGAPARPRAKRPNRAGGLTR
jgi:hypothetical protein